ncbi:MAG: GrpB family protein [Myxococcota bacterium]|jgi:GrpB-like predicted nucleotidyltransferase (UPF0157 family)|nr:GrpB family protein [Myxococcota bacterium]
MPKTIVVELYSDAWAHHFEALRMRLSNALDGIAHTIEHVGSTSVKGLAAKPVIDIDIIVAREQLDDAIEALSTLEYTHRGELGIKDRHAFRYEGEEELHTHNLYVCIEGAESLRNHLLLRDYLREHPDEARAYGALKQELARKHPRDIDAYVEGKSAFILAILEKQGMSQESLEAIEEANLASSQPPRE